VRLILARNPKGSADGTDPRDHSQTTPRGASRPVHCPFSGRYSGWGSAGGPESPPLGWLDRCSTRRRGRTTGGRKPGGRIARWAGSGTP
jgi:hypothetical protein